MEPHRSVWHASPGSQLPGKRTSNAPGSCQRRVLLLLMGGSTISYGHRHP
ncbi:hypothetical protein Tco_1389987, partial [Tanacetum coccineum]